MVGGESIAMQVHSRYYPGFGGYCKMVVRCSLVFLQGNFSNQHPSASEPEGFLGRHLKTSILVKVVLLLIEEILHQLTSNVSWYLPGFSTITGGDRRISRTINRTMLNCCINTEWMVVISKTLGTVWRGCSRWNLFIGGRKPDWKAVLTAAPSM